MDFEAQEARIRELVDEIDSDTGSDFSRGSGDEYNPDSESDSQSDIETDSCEEDIGDPDVPRSWAEPDPAFSPKFDFPRGTLDPPANSVPRSSSAFETFRKLFPYSLIVKITQHTNERISIYNQRLQSGHGDGNAKRKKSRSRQHVEPADIENTIAILIVMSYNNLPTLRSYWATHPSMGNSFIKSIMPRDRALFILSKLYFAEPDGVKTSKTYYIDQVVDCINYTSMKYREDSSFQSIDESMTKFKGRSSLKQYMPLKPVKRGIKKWMRCDPASGYTYFISIYCGKEDNSTGPLGERVVTNLVQTTKKPNVTFCFDRFFSGVELLEILGTPALGTVQTNRKYLPKFHDHNNRMVKLKPGDL